MNKYSTAALVHEMNLLMNRIAEHTLDGALNITYGRFIFLFTVQQCGAATQHQVAQALEVSDPAVSKMCAEALRDGVISITTNPMHKRQKLVGLTALGHSILQQCLAALDECFSDICMRAGLDEATYREQTTHLLHSLNSKYKSIAREP